MSTDDSARQLRALRLEILDNLLRAQQLLDSISPNSVAGARLQHVIDEIEEAISFTDGVPRRDDLMD